MVSSILELSSRKEHIRSDVPFEIILTIQLIEMLRKRTFDLISLKPKGILGQIPNNDNNQKERKQLQILTYVVKLQDGSTLTCHCTECVRAQETNTEIFACALSLVFILTDESSVCVRSAQGDIDFQSGQLTLI